MRSRFCFHISIVASVLGFPLILSAEKVEFNRSIRPILSKKCFQCHGADEASRQADLRLDVDQDEHGPFADRDGSVAIKPGDLETSEVWNRLTTDDEDMAMPPKESKKSPLSRSELELIRQWILQGANYETFWAFVPPKPRQIPSVQDKNWTQNRIDQFVKARLEKESLDPQPQADKRTLIRRVAFDLTGLPPTREEIERFLQDDTPDAHEKLVDRLIGSPHYGEHMAKYWLDLVRFADTNGIHHDHYREMTPYRDWVIRSFNENLSFDKFVVYQVAGDLFEAPTLDQQIASGFNRLHLVIDKGTAIPEESFTRNVIDRVTAVGTAFMGLTVGCAVCHDHKFDPVTQRDFYQLYAFFNNIDSGPETPGQGIHAPFIRVPDPSQKHQLIKFNEEIRIASDELESLKQSLEESPDQNVSTSESTSTSEINESAEKPEPPPELKLAEERLKQLIGKKKSFEELIPVSLVMKERNEARPTHILVRGAYDQPGEEVERNTPAFLPPLNSQSDVKSRMDLARWLTSADHPLTARVTVNRIWQQLFGVGLVKTSEDFGTQGEWPSHPDLLDELTTSFVASGWDVKNLVKSIVCSNTYQQSSKSPPSAFKSDPGNRMLARGSRFRLDAEMIRDEILAVSGLLNRSMFGKSVKPPQPPNLWKNVSMVSSSTYSFQADSGEKIFRRSLYSFWKRALPPPQMTIFDAPTREACTARRERTNTPLQALVLMNEEQYFNATKRFAQDLLDEPGDDEARIKIAHESITSHLPDQTELTILTNGLNALREFYRQDMGAAQALTSNIENVRPAADSNVPFPSPAQRNSEGEERVRADKFSSAARLTDAERIEIAAHTMLINSLFNLDASKTRE